MKTHLKALVIVLSFLALMSIIGIIISYIVTNFPAKVGTYIVSLGLLSIFYWFVWRDLKDRE